MNRTAVAKELVLMAKQIMEKKAAWGDKVTTVDPEALETLTGKLTSRIGQKKMQTLRMFNVDLKPSDTVETLARAWAKILLAP